MSAMISRYEDSNHFYNQSDYRSVPMERSYSRYEETAAAAGTKSTSRYRQQSSSRRANSESCNVSPARSPIPHYTRRQRSVTFVDRSQYSRQQSNVDGYPAKSLPYREERPEYHTITTESAVKAAKEQMAILMAQQQQQADVANGGSNKLMAGSVNSILVSNPSYAVGAPTTVAAQIAPEKLLSASYPYIPLNKASLTYPPSSYNEDVGAAADPTTPSRYNAEGSFMRHRSMTPRRKRAAEKRRAAEADMNFYDDSFVEEFVLSAKSEYDERDRKEREIAAAAEAERKKALFAEAAAKKRASTSLASISAPSGAVTAQPAKNRSAAQLLQEHTKRLQQHTSYSDDDNEQQGNDEGDDASIELRETSRPSTRVPAASMPMVSSMSLKANNKRQREDEEEGIPSEQDCPHCGSHSVSRQRAQVSQIPNETAAPTTRRPPRRDTASVTFASPLQPINSNIYDNVQQQATQQRKRGAAKTTNTAAAPPAPITTRRAAATNKRAQSLVSDGDVSDSDVDSNTALLGAKSRNKTRAPAKQVQQSSLMEYQNEGNDILDRLSSMDRPVLLGRSRRGGGAGPNAAVQLFGQEAGRSNARRAADNEGDDAVFGLAVANSRAPTTSIGGQRARFDAIKQSTANEASTATRGPRGTGNTSASAFDPMASFFEAAFPTPSKFSLAASTIPTAVPQSRKKNTGGVSLPAGIARGTRRR